MTAVAAPRRAYHGAARTAVALGLGLAVLVAFLAVAGFDAPAALAALWRGAFGSWYAVSSVTLVHATPLILLGLAFALGSRAGALNIGMEGQFAAGAIAATWLALATPALPGPVSIPLVLAAGGVAGALWVAVPVLLRVRFGVTEVIATLLLNFVADAAVSYAVTGPLQEPTRVYPESSPIPSAARLPHLIPGTQLHAGFAIVIVVALALSLLLTRTRWGFALRAVGAGPTAAHLAGRVSEKRIVAAALLWSGALAGVGGAIEISGVTYALYQNLSPGYGFTAIAVALLGGERPLGIAVAGLLFGALEAGAGAMQRDAGIPAVAVQVVEAVVIITLLVSRRRRQP